MSPTSINYSATDWEAVVDTIQQLNCSGAPRYEKTDEDEDIIYEVGVYDGQDILVTKIFQHNGWVRKSFYYPIERVVETIYEKVRD